MRIVLDALGSDNCPDPEVQAALQVANEFGDDILLVGPADQLRDKLDALNGTTARVQIVNAPEAITMEDKGIKLALKAKRREAKNSMAVGIDLVKSGKRMPS